MITRIQFFQTCVESGNFSPLGFPSPKNGAKDPVVLRGRVVSSDWLHRSCCKGVQKHQHTHRLMLGMLLVWWMGRMGMKDLQVENIAIVHQSLKKLYMNIYIYIYYTYVNIYIYIMQHSNAESYPRFANVFPLQKTNSASAILINRVWGIFQGSVGRTENS